MSAPLLSVEGLEVDFERAGDRVPAVRGLSFEVAAGETVGIVGKSGSGKSVSMLAVLGLLPRPPAHRRARRLEFAGRDLLGLSDHELRSIRGREMAMIFQDPLAALNPVLPVGFQIGEVLVRHLGLARAAVRARVLELLAHVGVPDPAVRIDQFPHQLSGGMRQRIMIAMALAAVPKLLIADEPTTALDVTVQAEIVRLVKDLQGETRDGHDLGDPRFGVARPPRRPGAGDVRRADRRGGRRNGPLPPAATPVHCRIAEQYPTP